MKHARISLGVVAEVIEVPDGASLADMFHPDLVAHMVPVTDDGVSAGWLYEEGVFSTPSPPSMPAPTIPDVTARQLRLWLLSRGVALSEVDAAIEALPVGVREPARIEWEYSTVYQRGHALIEMLGPELGFSDEEIDAGFVEAAAL